MAMVDARAVAGLRCLRRRGRVSFGSHICKAADDVTNVLTVLASPALRSAS
jgi:hypothetical protein